MKNDDQCRALTRALTTAVLASVLLLPSATAQIDECAIWGQMAEVLASDFDTRVKYAGRNESEAMRETKEMIDFDYHLEAEGMGRTYYTAVISAVEVGVRGEALHKIGVDVCRSYPSGTFDPDSFGR